jgi:1-acyl-sn-glycerol-3-phosphate acyltransferase
LCFFFSITFPLMIIAPFVKGRTKFYQRALAFFSRLGLMFAWINIEIVGKDNLKRIDPAKGLLIAVNHHSFLDTFVLLANLPFPLRLVVYPAGFRVPILKTIYKRAGYIGLTLKKNKTTPHLFSLFKALQKGDRIVVYSVPVDGNRKDFKFSPALIELAKRFDVPILPIAIKGAAKILPMDRYWLGPGKVALSIGRPSHFSSPEELKREVIGLHARIS